MGMNIRESSYGYWSSTRAFVWVAAGAAIGIGNIARLPYLMSEYGGSVFLAVYLAALLLLGLPLLLAEWMLGRWMRDDLVSGFSRLAQSAGGRRSWGWLGGLALLCAALILSYYSVIAGWSLGYTFRGAAGTLSGLDEAGARSVFLSLAQDAERGLSWHTLFMVAVCVIVSHGFREGIERAAGYLVPAAFLLMIVMAVCALVYGDGQAAAQAMFAPQPARLGWRGVVEALQQAFFTLGLGFGVMATLGTYLPASVPLLRVGLLVILLDTLFSVIVGLAVMALLLQAGIAPVPGLSLVFQSLPQSLPPGLAGIAIATLFYLVLFIVTLTSATVLLEPVTRYLMDRYRITRVFAATSAAVAIWYLGLGTLLSFGPLAELRVLGQNFFEWLQFLTTTLMAPLSGLLLAIFVTRIIPWDLMQSVWAARERVALKPWHLALRYPARLGLVVILLYAFGLLDWLANLWS